MTGILPVDKPAGPTSHDVVAMARKALGERRIGHTGTLDPFATGLMLLCIGPATRLAEYFSGLDKCYRGEARLGVATDTLDHTGAVVAESDAWRELDEARIRAAFTEQVGTLAQLPPAYSAKRVGGRRAHEMARAGEEVRPEAVKVTIASLDVESVARDRVRFDMCCSSGTYVRAVARDAGDALGVGAHLTELRRTRVGRFDVADAIPVDRLDDDDAVRAALLDPLAALAHLPRVDLDDEEAARVGHGGAVDEGGRVGERDGERGGARDPESGLVALAHRGALLAVAEAGDGMLRPRKVFA